MKRFWLVLLSLGLVLAFSASAMAVDVKFSGSFYAAGVYLDKTTFRSTYDNGYGVAAGLGSVGPSTAFYYQRLRVQSDFIVSPGLKLVTRFDAMERIWGGVRGESTASAAVGYDTGSAGTRIENQNIAFDWAYINYVSPIGTFDVGIMNDGTTGTVFGDSSVPTGRIKYTYTTGPATIYYGYTKSIDNSRSAVNWGSAAWNHTDADNDKHGVGGYYTWKDGKAGVQLSYQRYAEKRPASYYKKTYFLLTPYAIAKIGPVNLQAELNYAWGKARRYDSELLSIGAEHISMDNISGLVDATVDFNQVYFGGTVAYVSGNDWKTTHEDGGTLNGGIDWNPTLIMFNQDRTYWAGTLPGYGYAVSGTGVKSGAYNDSPMTNAWFYQGRVGVRPTPSWDIMASVSYADADQRLANFAHRSYGWEVDLTGTYKITNNLYYMLGAGYLWTGNYYEGSNEENSGKLNDNYMLINKLTLTF